MRIHRLFVMRILWLCPVLRAPARICAESLISLGADVMLVTANLHPEPDSITRHYEQVLLGRPVPTKDWINIAKVYRRAREFKPDVVVTELMRDPRWRVFGHLAPRVNIVHDDRPHDATHEDPWWIRSFRPWDARADAAVVFSDFVAKQVGGINGSRPPVYTAPLLTDFDPLLVPSFVPGPERSNFVLVGRQRPYKNHGVIFAAWDAHVHGSSWRGDELVVIGEGDIPVELPPQSRWIKESFRYRDVVGQLAGAKGSLVHERNASQSGSQLMSMQLGVAPIVSTSGALPEYQAPGLPIVGIDDVDGLTQAFNDLADPERAEAQGRMALQRYKEKYDTTVAARRLLEIFDDVLGDKPR